MVLVCLCNIWEFYFIWELNISFKSETVFPKAVYFPDMEGTSRGALSQDASLFSQPPPWDEAQPRRSTHTRPDTKQASAQLRVSKPASLEASSDNPLSPAPS